MVQRTRAWRRRKTRNVIEKAKATKEWFLRQFADRKPKEEKQHRHGALTHAQDLRTHWTTELELRDGMNEPEVEPEFRKAA